MTKIDSPLRVRGKTFKNSIYMPPMATGKTPDGFVTDALVDYYFERAQSGIAAVIQEHSYICPQGRAHAGQISISRDEDVQGLARIADAVHQGGALAFIQISHAGRTAGQEDANAVNLGPVDQVWKNKKVCAMTLDDIGQVKEAFVKAALRAQKAGYDGVEVHAAHGYLLNQFYSPLANHRTDSYGGPLENRIRFTKEVVESIRTAADDAFIVGVRLGACDYTQGGSTVEDGAAASAILEKAGADFIDVTGGLNGYLYKELLGHEGYFDKASKAIKEGVSIPVLMAGGIRTRQGAEELLSSGSLDMAGIGRPLFKDPVYARELLMP